MKKVGVITFFDHENYGAVLQAYGLKCALEELGCTVSFIRNSRDRSSGSAEKDRMQRVLEALRRRQDALRPLRSTFTDFSEKHFRTEDLDERHDLNSEYDFFLAGSDQVWNMEITGYDPFWFLDFSLPEKRCSYAPSFGMDALPESSLPWYRERLAGFTNLSVRETSGQKIIRELTGKEAAVCPDPVLLPERRVWEALMTPAEKAVVLYMTEFDDTLYRLAKTDASERNLPFTVLSSHRLSLEEKAPVCSPETWLGTIANADVIYTNSFHALVFSHIFHKEMRIRPLVRMKNRNGRLFSFLSSMSESLAETENNSGLFRLSGCAGPDNGETVDSRLNSLRKTGLSYLKSITDCRKEHPLLTDDFPASGSAAHPDAG